MVRGCPLALHYGTKAICDAGTYLLPSRPGADGRTVGRSVGGPLAVSSNPRGPALTFPFLELGGGGGGRRGRLLGAVHARQRAAHHEQQHRHTHGEHSGALAALAALGSSCPRLASPRPLDASMSRCRRRTQHKHTAPGGVAQQLRVRSLARSLARHVSSRLDSRPQLSRCN